MLGENLAALFLLYARPVAAMSKILDRGKLWFAIVAALAVSGLMHMPEMQTASRDQVLPPGARAAIARMAREARAKEQSTSTQDASTQSPSTQSPSTQTSTTQTPTTQTPTTQAPTQQRKSPVQPADDDDDGPPAPGFVQSAVFSWIGMGGFIGPIGAVALGFIPVVVFVRSAAGYGSFGVLMRRDYMALLMTMLFLWAAAYLPVAAIATVAGAKAPMMAISAAGAVYFLVMAALGLRTLLGVDFAPALGLAAIGSIGGVVALGISEIAGPLRFIAMSPFFLIYGAYYFYSRFMSEARTLGDGLRSRQHFQQQLQIATTNPADADAHYQLGLIYQSRRQYTEAIKRFQRAIEIDPKEADAHYHLGQIARVQKRIDEAIGYLETASRLDDKLSQNDVWRELGASYFDAGRIQDAGPALAKFIDRRPYDPEGLYWFGKTLASVGRKDDARAMFERAVDAVKTMPPHRRAEVRWWGRASKSELGKL